MSFGALSGPAKEALGRGASAAGTSTTTGAVSYTHLDVYKRQGLDTDLAAAIGGTVTADIKDTHVVLDVPADKLDAARGAVTSLRPGVKVMSAGESIEIFKEVGLLSLIHI